MWRHMGALEDDDREGNQAEADSPVDGTRVQAPRLEAAAREQTTRRIMLAARERKRRARNNT